MERKNTSKNQRPQNRWDKKNGYISKSYKLYKSYVDGFANACAHENITQASQLSLMLDEFTAKTERRYSVMYVREKYVSNNNYTNTFHSVVEKKLASISEKDIADEKKLLAETISSKKRFFTITDPLDLQKDFSCNMDLNIYLADDSSEIYTFISSKMIKQIALFHLVNERRLMPTQLRTNTKIEVNLSHNKGNSLFDVFLDLYPFETFIVL